MPMSRIAFLESLNMEIEEDEILLVQARGYTNWFLDMLEAMGIDWELIEGCPWIQFEILSAQLRALMQTFSDVQFDLLE
jgi:hypothetical protein